jgi:cytochrome b involved in lipid metabolism
VVGYTIAQVALHATATDCWSAISGSVYNLTAFIPVHPGGTGTITRNLCGKDGTAAYLGQHDGSAAADDALAPLKIGVLLP